MVLCWVGKKGGKKKSSLVCFFCLCCLDKTNQKIKILIPQSLFPSPLINQSTAKKTKKIRYNSTGYRLS